MNEYSVHGRGGIGIKNYNVTQKTGKIAAVEMVNDGDDILVITDDATIIRMAVERISVLSRSTQGVRIMRLSEGSRVISIEKTESDGSDDSASEPEETAEAPAEE